MVKRVAGGDTVRVSAHVPLSVAGQVGRVLAPVGPYQEMVSVYFDDGRTIPFRHEELTTVAATPPMED